MSILIDDITFDNPVTDARRHWQDIIHKGEVIGAICETSKGLLLPLDTRYQVCVPEKHAPLAESWYTTEDKGYIFACFDTLDKFVEFVNEIQ